MESIYKENSFVRKYIQHHIKYIETHGVDETVWITISDHHKIDHRKLFPMVTQKELAKIASKAGQKERKEKAINHEDEMVINQERKICKT